MNISACNMRSSFTSVMPSQKRQFHHAAAPSLENMIQNNNIPAQNSDKQFQNPNIFNPNTFQKSIPSSYKHSNHQEDIVQGKNSVNCCVLILEETKQIAPIAMEVEESSNLPQETIFQSNRPKSENSFSKSSVAPVNMEVNKGISGEEMSCSDCDDDSFIIFETATGSSKRPSLESPIIEFIDEDESSSDEDDDDWGKETLVFHNSNRNRDRQSSLCESEDSFIVFDDEDLEVDSDGKEMKCGNVTFMVFSDEESDEDLDEKEKKSDNGKKVTFAEGADLCKVHLMVKWSFAYKKARKGLWEQFGRDNEIFKYRAEHFGMKLNKFLQPEHRQKVYAERFKEGIE